MNIIEIIEKKKAGKELTTEEIYYFIEGITNDYIKDYQASALLMAVCLKGMNYRETYDLTMAMRYSGDIMNLSQIGRTVVDKHSTGGIGDKTTLIVGPVMAALDVPVAKMSGRGLGITGGTIDKLDSIPGFSSDVSDEDFIRLVKTVGMVDAAQTKNLAPADKFLYALRDVTATVDSLPLIASSIMSKKLASGADCIVLDVKCGSGAFMKDKESAAELARVMIDIGKRARKKCVAVISDMNQPLGYTVGNSLEVEEAMLFLSGIVQNPRLKKLVIALCIEMYKLSDKYCSDTDCKSFKSDAEIEELICETIDSGKALEKFREFAEAQGGDLSFVDDFIEGCREAFDSQVDYMLGVDYDGLVERIFYMDDDPAFIEAIDAETVGRMSLLLGAGRIRKEDDIDLGAGIVLNKVVGDRVESGDLLATLYSNNKRSLTSAVRLLSKAYTYSETVSDRMSEGIIIETLV